MPDAMSPDPLVDVVAKVICGWPTLCAAHTTEAERLIRGLHAAGYRVVAAESDAETPPDSDEWCVATCPLGAEPHLHLTKKGTRS